MVKTLLEIGFEIQKACPEAVPEAEFQQFPLEAFPLLLEEPPLLALPLLNHTLSFTSQ